jgi:hypothetical protein
VHKSAPNISPPGEKTGFARAGCYLNGTNNCSDDLTAEHYFSKSVLQAGGQNTVWVRDYIWQPNKGEKRSVGINALTAKILCSRHNACLSPLDTEAALFFKLLRDGMRSNPMLSNQGRSITVSGEAIERWMLKVVCGQYFAKIARFKDKPVRGNFTIDEKLMLDAFEGKWRPYCGLYVNKKPKVLRVDSALGIAVKVHEPTKRYLGAEIYLVEIAFLLMFDLIPIAPLMMSPSMVLQRAGWWPRPSKITIASGTSRFTAELCWPPGTPANETLVTRIVSKGGDASKFQQIGVCNSEFLPNSQGHIT